MTNPFKKEKTIIIATLGPSTIEEHLLKKVEDRGVDFVRINLSHTSVDKVEETVQYITDTISTPLMIDTEGSQVRTGDLGVDSIILTMGNQIRVYKKHIICDEGNIYIEAERKYFESITSNQINTTHIKLNQPNKSDPINT